MQYLQSNIPALIWLFVITLLSTKGGVSLPSFDLFQMDKVGHAGAYGLLVGLSLYGLHRYQILDRAPFRLGFWVFLLATLYGVLMEFVQFEFFPNRHFEVDDMLANALGAAAGWWFFSKIKRHLPVKSIPAQKSI